MGTKYAHKRIRTELAEQIKSKENSLRHEVPDPDKLKADIARDKQILTDMTPPDLTSETRKILERRQEKLTDIIRAGRGGSMTMPTEDEMKRANAIGEDKHTVHQAFILHNKMTSDGTVVRCKYNESSLADEWKDNQRTLHREAEDDLANIANLETIRPQGNQGASRLIEFASAQFAPGANSSYEQWVFAHCDSWPPYNGVKAGLYAPFFRLDDQGNIVRDGTYHPSGEGFKKNPFAGKEEKAEPAKAPAPEQPTVQVESGPPYTRCQATNVVSKAQCKFESLNSEVPYCRLKSHRAQFGPDQVSKAS